MRVFSSLSLFGKLMTDPVKTWEKLSLKEESVKGVFLNYFLIIVFCSSLFAFSGVFIHTGRISLAIAQFINVFISLVVGLSFAAKLLVLTAPNFMTEVSAGKIFKWTIYSASAFVFFHGLSQLFASHSFLSQICLLFELYSIRLLWLGLGEILSVSDSKKIGYVFLAGVFMLVLPLICERIFSVIFQSILH